MYPLAVKAKPPDADFLDIWTFELQPGEWGTAEAYVSAVIERSRRTAHRSVPLKDGVNDDDSNNDEDTARCEDVKDDRGVPYHMPRVTDFVQGGVSLSPQLIPPFKEGGACLLQ